MVFDAVYSVSTDEEIAAELDSGKYEKWPDGRVKKCDLCGDFILKGHVLHELPETVMSPYPDNAYFCDSCAAEHRRLLDHQCREQWELEVQRVDQYS